MSCYKFTHFHFIYILKKFTDAGDASLFTSLESLIINNIPLEPTEWRRSYGRPVKSVYIESAFVPFNKDNLPKAGVRKLLEQPILHIYWTECSVSMSHF